VKVPGTDGPGQWTTALTVRGLHKNYGGASLARNYLLLGQLDRRRGTFKPNLQAKALNSLTADHFGLMLEPSKGLLAVFDRNDGVYFSARSSGGAAFSTPVKVRGISSRWVDPALGYVQGSLRIFYAQRTQRSSVIVMQSLKVTQNPLSAAVSGSPITVVQAHPKAIVHSPTPIINSKGEVHGLWLAQRVGNDSDMYFKAGLDLSEPHVRTFDNSSWLNNGAVAGGSLYAANYGNSYASVLEAPATWLVGADTRRGGIAEVFGGAPLTGKTTNFAQLLTSSGTTHPLSIPGFYGKLVLNPLQLMVVGSPRALDADGRYGWRFAIPNDSSLIDTQFPVQSLSLGVSPGRITGLSFSNLAYLSIESRKRGAGSGFMVEEDYPNNLDNPTIRITAWFRGDARNMRQALQILQGSTLLKETNHGFGACATYLKVFHKTRSFPSGTQFTRNEILGLCGGTRSGPITVGAPRLSGPLTHIPKKQPMLCPNPFIKGGKWTIKGPLINAGPVRNTQGCIYVRRITRLGKPVYGPFEIEYRGKVNGNLVIQRLVGEN